MSCEPPFAGTLVLIDGRSGSGKTTLARKYSAERNWQLVGLDECYPGWNGLDAGAAMIAHSMLRRGVFTTFDWQAHERGPQRVLDTAIPLVVEGCGSIRPDAIATAQTLGMTVYRVWIECDTQVRKSRALTRDGDMFRPYWGMWARQEEAHQAKHQPVGRANRIIHTTVLGS